MAVQDGDVVLVPRGQSPLRQRPNGFERYYPPTSWPGPCASGGSRPTGRMQWIMDRGRTDLVSTGLEAARYGGACLANRRRDRNRMARGQRSARPERPRKRALMAWLIGPMRRRHLRGRQPPPRAGTGVSAEKRGLSGADPGTPRFRRGPVHPDS